MVYLQSQNYKTNTAIARYRFQESLLIMSALFNLNSFTNSNAKVQRLKPRHNENGYNRRLFHLL